MIGSPPSTGRTEILDVRTLDLRIAVPQAKALLAPFPSDQMICWPVSARVGNDLIVEILGTTCHLIIAGLRGNAEAGGAMLALAADRVYAMSGVVLNPHYRSVNRINVLPGFLSRIGARLDGIEIDAIGPEIVTAKERDDPSRARTGAEESIA